MPTIKSYTSLESVRYVTIAAIFMGLRDGNSKVVTVKLRSCISEFLNESVSLCNFLKQGGKPKREKKKKKTSKEVVTAAYSSKGLDNELCSWDLYSPLKRAEKFVKSCSIDTKESWMEVNKMFITFRQIWIILQYTL